MWYSAGCCNLDLSGTSLSRDGGGHQVFWLPLHPEQYQVVVARDRDKGGLVGRRGSDKGKL